jgi:hypothetical protein
MSVSMIFWPDDVKGIIHHGGDRYWLDRHNKKYANLFWHTQQIQSAQKSEEIYGDRETSVTKIIERKKEQGYQEKRFIRRLQERKGSKEKKTMKYKKNPNNCTF